MSNSPVKKYSFAADVVRVVAIIGVVSIHVFIAVYERTDFQGGKVWWLTNFWNALSRPAIPLFIMLSGFLLLPKKESSNKVKQRIVHRLVIPLLSFFILSQFWNSGHASFQNLHPWLLASSFVQARVGILYFLIIMIGLYTFLPLIRKVFVPLSFKRQLWATTGFILGGMGLVLVEYLSGNFFLSNLFLLWIPYLGFFLAGHVLTKIKLGKLWRSIVFMAYLSMVIFTTILSDQYLSQTTRNLSLFPVGALSPYYDFHLSPNLVIMSLTLFTLLFQFDYKILEKIAFAKPAIKKIAQASLGIYLLHSPVVIILETYFNFSVDYTKLPLILYLITKFLLVFGGAYWLTAVFKRTVILRRMVGEKN